jgi:hypothetical protein
LIVVSIIAMTLGMTPKNTIYLVKIKILKKIAAGCEPV